MTDSEIPALRRHELDELREHWGTAYWVQYDGLTWSASPLSAPSVLLTAETSRQLRESIRLDYQHNNRRNLREPG